jgi:hypothetical protein
MSNRSIDRICFVSNLPGRLVDPDLVYTTKRAAAKFVPGKIPMAAREEARY